MIRKILLFLSIFFIILNHLLVSGQAIVTEGRINDGPYIFYEDTTLKVKWIENNILFTENLVPGSFSKIRDRFNLLCSYDDMKSVFHEKTNYRQNFRKVDSIGIISDIHGEYTTYINLMKAMRIVDNDLNWSFGKGHLVILGDAFDRGESATEILWHLFGLEKQAALAGGMVHFLLGNHEILVLSKKLNYINDKYRKAEEILGINYSDLYSENSVLGKWIRTRPVIIGINNILFTHGGISIDMVNMNMNITKVNHIFSTRIVGRSMSDNAGDYITLSLAGSNGPLWYRGYFEGDKIKESDLDLVLDYYQKKHIVVGHTSCEAITLLYNNKVIGVDAGLGHGLPGAMVIYKKGIFYQGTCSGGRVKIIAE